ncbi:MAG: 6-phosphogluconolactonase [Candidatus Saccharimonadales bacterium]|nr:6-phosphogluconolactonase [Candidatus Saccharimonadales bacterium]
MIKVFKLDDCQLAQDEAVKKLQSILDEADRPLLLLSGGSSVKVAMQLIKNSLGLNRWTIAQVDERYGAVGHRFSNWKALLDAGLEPQRFAQVVPVLSDGLDIEKTTKVYEQQLKQVVADADLKVALIGIGADGHIAGMLPKNKNQFERQFQDEHLVTHFSGPDYERITITQSAINAMDEIVAFSCGSGKPQAVRKLDDDLPIYEHPAQMLKYTRKISIYTTKE